MLLLTGTLPAAALGVFLESRIKQFFASPYEAAGFLVVNGFLMLGAEVLRRRAERRYAARTQGDAEERFTDAAHISFRAAAIVGACQALAFLGSSATAFSAAARANARCSCSTSPKCAHAQ